MPTHERASARPTWHESRTGVHPPARRSAIGHRRSRRDFESCARRPRPHRSPDGRSPGRRHGPAPAGGALRDPACARSAIVGERSGPIGISPQASAARGRPDGDRRLCWGWRGIAGCAGDGGPAARMMAGRMRRPDGRAADGKSRDRVAGTTPGAPRMQAAQDSSVMTHLGHPIGEPIGPVESLEGAANSAVAASGPATSGGGDTILVGPVELSITRVAKRRHQLTARRVLGGDVLAVTPSTCAGRPAAAVHRAGPRALDPAEPEAMAPEHGLDQALLQLASAPDGPAAPGHAAAHEAELRARGCRRSRARRPLYDRAAAQIANFDMRSPREGHRRRRRPRGEPPAAGDPPPRPGARGGDDGRRVRQQRPAPHRRLRLGPPRRGPEGGRRCPRPLAVIALSSRDPPGDDRHRLDGGPLEVPGSRRLRRRRRLPRRRPGPGRPPGGPGACEQAEVARAAPLDPRATRRGEAARRSTSCSGSTIRP